MKLFTRIFFSFWVATVLMVALVLSVSEFLPVNYPRLRGRNVDPQIDVPAIRAAINTFEREGIESFRVQVQNTASLRRSSLAVFDGQANLVASTSKRPELYTSLAQDVASTGRIQLLRYGLRTLYAYPLESATGRHYVAVLVITGPQNRLASLRFWMNFGLAMIPLALVCLVLTAYITRPITRLQLAARRLAQGELTARAGPLEFNRRDELADLARDFDAMAAQIESLMTAQRRFVADVSHELGGPLTRMHLALALLRRDSAGAPGGALQRIERETDKLSNLVQQLLLLAGLEAGRIPAETFALVSIRTLCESIVEDANFEALHANCRVIGERQDAQFAAYPNLLRRAIDNVLRNAIRYAPSGTDIELNSRTDRPQNEVVIEVLDHGPGVPEAMLRDIFAPFFRTAPGREASSGGTGLGLAIASEAIKMHNGSIAAENRPGGGLHVTMRLPLRTSPIESAGLDGTVAEERATS
jgi:two-component system, OmpR family, sensor histidine kinase CpxA